MYLDKCMDQKYSTLSNMSQDLIGTVNHAQSIVYRPSQFYSNCCSLETRINFQIHHNHNLAIYAIAKNRNKKDTLIMKVLSFLTRVYGIRFLL